MTSQIRDRTYYFLAALVGVLTGVVGSIFHTLVDHTLDWSRHLPDSIGLTGPLLYLALAAFSAAMFCGAVFLVRRFAPEASGSGVQEIEGAMQGLREIRWARVLPVKFIGGTMALGAGMLGGREGPTIHMGASIARAISAKIKLTAIEARALWGAGGAAGLTAAFNAPLASVAFIIEEARDAFPYHVRTYGAVILACGFSAITTTALTGRVPYLAMSADAMPTMFLPAFIVLGLVLGVLGVAFNRFLIFGLDFARQVGLRVSPYLIPLLLGLAIGPMLAVFPQITGGGEPLVVALANHPLSIGMLALVVLLRFFLTTASYATGAPAGIFAPILALATSTSVLCASLLALLMPLPPGAMVAFAAAGMAGLFSSTVRSPLVGIVLVLELTGTYTLAIPALLCAVTAYLVSAAMGGKPIYEVLLARTLQLAQEQNPSAAVTPAATAPRA